MVCSCITVVVAALDPAAEFGDMVPAEPPITMVLDDTPAEPEESDALLDELELSSADFLSSDFSALAIGANSINAIKPEASNLWLQKFDALVTCLPVTCLPVTCCCEFFIINPLNIYFLSVLDGRFSGNNGKTFN